ncbi:MAG TPA: histidine kinase [Chitinophagaceae bacterium]|nr:histidine kinase [Chitinophagaceae bacterium]
MYAQFTRNKVYCYLRTSRIQVIKLNSKYKTVFLHVLVWSLLFTLPHLFMDNRNIRPGSFPVSFYTVTNLYHIGLFYLNVFVLYPLFFNKRRWWVFILIIAAILVVSFYLKLFITRQWYSEVIIDKWTYRILFFPPVPFLIASTIYRIVVDKIAYDKKQKEIVAEQLAMKLKFLRSQISPHFIFNVLTNLVSLARKKSEQLEPQLIKLSDLMRYILYESDEKKVPLAKEIEYLESYIELQKLRFGHDVAINVNLRLDENELQRSIEPMLLIPFVENAFKHGMGVDQPMIEIELAGDEGKLEFDVKNKFNEDGTETKDMSSGIGLENVQSRLALLYPKEHKLVIRKEDNLFHIHLTLQLR